MKTLAMLSLALFASILISACGNGSISNQSGLNGDFLSGRLIITGSSTIAPLATEIARQFELLHPNSKVDVQTGGSSRGISDVRRGIVNIGMVSRKLRDKESDLTSHLLAKDGVSIVTHKDNPVIELNEEQIRKIYQGKITNWSELGQKAMPISVINKAEGRSTLEVFLKYFGLKNSEIKADTVIGDNQQAIKLVERNPGAIAYVSIGTAEYDINNGSPIKTLPLKGIEASTVNLQNNTFPISRELNLITIDKTNPLGEAFITYAKSKDTHPLIEQFGFVAIE